MKRLNEIISENAKLALDRATKRHEEDGQSFTLMDVCRAIEKKLGAEHMQSASAYRIIKEMFKKPRTPRRWSSDLIEGFAYGVGEVPEKLVTASGALAEVTNSGHLRVVIAGRFDALDRKIAKRFIEVIDRSVEDPVFFALLIYVAEEALAAETREDADVRISEVIRKSRAWADHRRARKK